MQNLDMLLKWEKHPSRRLYAYEDLGAKKPCFNFFTGDAERTDLEPEYRWYIERNHFGWPVYMTGVADKNKKLKKLGQEVLSYGIAKQTSDGRFPCWDQHHSAAFFFESLARYIALADLTDAGDIGPHANALGLSLTWFNKRSEWNDNWWRDSMHHRFFLNAASCFMGWELLNGVPGSIQEQAYAWMDEGIRRQAPDGAHTEMGGRDTAYHSCSILYGAVVLMICDIHPDFADRLTLSLVKAVNWLLPAVGRDGVIDAALNARTGSRSRERNRETGAPKDHKPYETAFALYGAGLVLEDGRCIEAANRIVGTFK